ncbi:MAG: hypothetical protein IPN76_16320 [Saprospiraceae bacterium]|nr:hypothetical protein [Saprospiraceae bacterium]
MKTTIALFLALSISSSLKAQKTDYDWLFGFCLGCQPTDSINGMCHFDFNEKPASAYRENIDFSIFQCNVSASDAAGNLLFYSNCVDIFNAANEKMSNSNGFNNYPFHDGYLEGLPMAQGMIAFESPGNPSEFFVLHMKMDIEPLQNELLSFGVGLYFSKIDMNGDGGLGQMTAKGIPVIVDTLARGGLLPPPATPMEGTGGYLCLSSTAIVITGYWLHQTDRKSWEAK